MQVKLVFLLTAMALFGLMTALTRTTITPARAADNSARLLAVGGPDFYGYTWSDGPLGTDWIDTTTIGTDTGLTGSGVNNATGPIPLGFSFNYYTNSYTQLYISAAGYVSFTNQASWPGYQNIPSTSPPNNVIAPYSTLTFIGSGSWVHYMTGGSAPNRYFVVEWHDLTVLPEDETYRFELILHENGDIVFQYDLMNYVGESWLCASSGIENDTGQYGLLYIYACGSSSVASNTAVRFDRPVNPHSHVYLPVIMRNYPPPPEE